MRRLAWLAVSLFGLLSLQACGGDSTASTPPPPPPPPPAAITVSVSPDNQQVDQGATLTFSVTVNGTTDQRVTWSVFEGAGSGTISDAGVYTAPAHTGTYHVVATSVADPTKAGSVVLNVSEIFVNVEPWRGAMLAGTTQQFTARVYGTVLDTSVAWEVQGGSGAGSITPDGLYTPPVGAGGPYVVIATSNADPTRNSYGQVWVETRDFNLVGEMVLERTNHTATKLPNGDVLLVGGAGQAGSADPGSEIFEVASNTFRSSGAMSAVRYGHSATMLQDGKVLITGGRNTAGSWTHCSTNTAELYDPATDTFSPTGSMATARSFHTAVLLPNGKVLVAGGATSSADTSNGMEIYDPLTGQFSTAGTMSVNRVLHTATLLGNGKVLIAGGEGSGTSQFTADIYDAAAGISGQVNISPRSRNGHTATVLPDGSVLLGGGGIPPGFVYRQTRIYYPATNTVSADVALFTPRMFHTSTLFDAVNGRVVLTGGTSDMGESISAAEVFDGTGFHPILSTKRARSGHAATLLDNGKVLITGGAGDRSAEIY